LTAHAEVYNNFAGLEWLNTEGAAPHR